mmetsp:Transcript_28107/g.66757  ORF Transcript_28107/g.66757 Transcript_28107/m.66757 type:complete len:368 (-) Transcript_28107:614-1717(-)
MGAADGRAVQHEQQRAVLPPLGGRARHRRLPVLRAVLRTDARPRRERQAAELRLRHERPEPLRGGALCGAALLRPRGASAACSSAGRGRHRAGQGPRPAGGRHPGRQLAVGGPRDGDDGGHRPLLRGAQLRERLARRQVDRRGARHAAAPAAPHGRGREVMAHRGDHRGGHQPWPLGADAGRAVGGAVRGLERLFDDGGGDDGLHEAGLCLRRAGAVPRRRVPLPAARQALPCDPVVALRRRHPRLRRGSGKGLRDGRPQQLRGGPLGRLRQAQGPPVCQRLSKQGQRPRMGRVEVRAAALCRHPPEAPAVAGGRDALELCCAPAVPAPLQGSRGRVPALRPRRQAGGALWPRCRLHLEEAEGTARE